MGLALFVIEFAFTEPTEGSGDANGEVERRI
jgi:hypothetical protein